MININGLFLNLGSTPIRKDLGYQGGTMIQLGIFGSGQSICIMISQHRNIM